ncbi:MULTISPECIES: hypothetical protein [unclassified Mesorhizobium]|uniref:hypothetical protein n=1 Tax=unclassified Mesorhizobium TaxID=325217 RepID=UPI0033392984
MTTLPIDLHLHKAIEAHRLNMSETQLDIVKRVFGIGSNGNVSQMVQMELESGRVRHGRRGGEYEFVVNGERMVRHSLKEVLKAVILAMEKTKKGAIERISTYRTPRGRRVVAKKNVEIYPGNPELVEKSAERLNGDWWFDTNISRNQLKRYIQKVLEWSGFEASFVELRF